MHRQYLHVGDRTIAYFDSAPGDAGAPVLVLLHAFPLSAAMWEPQLREPPPGWRLLAPDLAGFGGSTDPAGGASGVEMDDYARDVVDLLTELGIPGAVIGGLSMGGYVAFAICRRAPGLVRALILADTRATADSSEGRAARRTTLAQVDREGAGGLARDMLPKLIGPTTMNGPTQVESTIRRIIKQQSADAIRGGLRRMMERPDSTADAAALTVPTLVIVGDEDQITPPAEAEALAALIPSAELAVIVGAGHLSSLEQPAAFGERVGVFLSRL